MTKLFLHPGLHKSGTTSIQHFLGEHSSLIAKANVTYDVSEKFSYGNTNHYRIHGDLGLHLHRISLSNTNSIISCEDIFPLLANSDFMAEFTNGFRESIFTECYILITLSTDFPNSRWLEQLLIQELSSVGSHTADYLTKHLCEYLDTVYKSFELIQDQLLSKPEFKLIFIQPSPKYAKDIMRSFFADDRTYLKRPQIYTYIQRT